MKIYKIFIFLLLLSPSQPTWACIDDPEEYYDDNDDGDWDDDEDWDDDGDWLDGGELPGVTVIGHYYDEEDGSSLDDYENYIDGGELDGPTIYGHSPDNNNENESDDTDEEDDDWNWDYDDEEEHNILITGNGSSSKKYNLKESDKLVKSINKMPKPGYKQGIIYSCLPAGLVFASILFNGKEMDEGSIIKMFVDRTKSLSVVFGVFDESTISSDVAAIAELLGFESQENISNIPESIENGQIILTNIATDKEDQTHDIIIVGYNDDGYIGYDTDIHAGYYKIISPYDIRGSYSVGLKK